VIPSRTILSAPAIAAALLLSGCEVPASRQHQASADAQPAAAPASSDQAAISRHLDDLERKISQLEGQLGQSHGALRNGPSFSVDGGQESVLERQRRLQKELGEAHAAIAAKEQLIADLRRDLEVANHRGENLAEKADSLGHVQDSLVTAQQELAERQAKLATLAEQLALSELARLRAEKSYYVVAGGLLKLAPGQTQELVDLQEQVRLQVKELQPADGAPGAKR
jgi:hypothetical protein